MKACSSLDAQALLAATVLLLPSAWTDKLIALGVGLLCVNVLNMARIATLYYVGAYHPAYFELLHEEVLPLLLLSLTLVLLWTFVQRLPAPSQTVQPST
ncbi:MAG: archaeosortase/exosortase family protein [Myxococcales bacterium]|nr:archaeosortase/exosortase family protein [Myxococcales bacterium]